MKKSFPLNNQLAIIAAGFVGTSFMTLYSYVISAMQKVNFKEPLLLGKLTGRLIPCLDNKNSKVAGWGLHYLVGLLFAEAYSPFWSEHTRERNIKTGLIIGGLSGFAAILIWKFTLEAHPFPPSVNFPRFAGQLVIAHILFGLFASIVYNAANQHDNHNKVR